MANTKFTHQKWTEDCNDRSLFPIALHKSGGGRSTLNGGPEMTEGTVSTYAYLSIHDDTGL